MKLLLVDDHPLFLDGLQSLLATRGYEVVATAGNGIEALAKAQEFKLDVILMDVFMPDCNGLEATRLIKAVLPECKIIMLTSAEDDENLFEAIKSGASGYLLKSLQAAELFDLLASLERGEAVFSSGLADRILKEFARYSATGKPDPDNNVKTVKALNNRQSEMLKLVAQGMTYKEIAAELGLSERTLKYHMGRILDILHMDTKDQANIKQQLENDTHLTMSGDNSTHMTFKYCHGIVVIDPSSIYFIEKSGNKCVVHTTRDQYDIVESLTALEKRLNPSAFFRCHKSFIINIRLIDKIVPYADRAYEVHYYNYPHKVTMRRDKFEQLCTLLGGDCK